MLRHLDHRTWLRVGCIAIVAMVLTPCLAQPEARPAPRPEMTTEGTFAGTWVYVSRERRIAMWIRLDDAGRPEARFQVFGVGIGESFRTDWTGRAEYVLAGAPAKFEAVARERDPDRVLGTWNWSVQGENAGRLERGSFEMYRTEDGRKIALVFPDFERSVRDGDREKMWSQPHTIAFIKVSKRLVQWEELPF